PISSPTGRGYEALAVGLGGVGEGLRPLDRVHPLTQLRLGAYGAKSSQRSPDGRGKKSVQCASFGVSIISVSTPPISLGWRKKIGVPCAPIRGSPSTRLPIA